MPARGRPDALNLSAWKDAVAVPTRLEEFASILRSVIQYPISVAVIDTASDASAKLYDRAAEAGLVRRGDVVTLVAHHISGIFRFERLLTDGTKPHVRLWHDESQQKHLKTTPFDIVIVGEGKQIDVKILKELSTRASLGLAAAGSDVSGYFDHATSEPAAFVERPIFREMLGADTFAPLVHSIPTQDQ